MGQDLYFYGWVVGEMEIKANLSQSLVEVEAELGKSLIYRVKNYSDYNNEIFTYLLKV